MRLLKFVVSVICSGFASPIFSQQVIEWDYNHQATALGSGCSMPETQIIAVGNEVSLILSHLELRLTGDNGEKVAKKTCRIAIPTRVRAGYYLSSLRRQLNYGYHRTDNTEGKLSFAANFYSQGFNLSRDIPSPELDPYDVVSQRIEAADTLNFNPQWCLRNDYIGNLTMNISLFGYRKSSSEDILISVDGQGVLLEATAKICP